MVNDYIICSIGQVRFLALANYVKEIVELPELKLLPGASDYLAGFMNLRGSIIPVLNTRASFNLPEIHCSISDFVVVFEYQQSNFAIIVSMIEDICENKYEDTENKDIIIKKTPWIEGFVKVGDEFLFSINISYIFEKLHEYDAKGLAVAKPLEFTSDEKFKHIFSDRAQRLIEKPVVENAGMISPILVILLNEDCFGIEPEQIKEICDLKDLSIIPLAPRFFLGNMNHRGTILPVIDILDLLSDQPSIFKLSSKIIVARFEEELIGFLVEDIVNIVDINQEQRKPVPLSIKSISYEFIKGAIHLEREVIAILDLNKIYTSLSLNPKGNIVS